MNKIIIPLLALIVIIIGITFLFTSNILVLDTSQLEDITKSKIPIPDFSTKHECAKLYDDYIEYELKIESQYYDYLSERTGG